MPDVLLTMFDGIYLESVIHHAGVDPPSPSPQFVSKKSDRLEIWPVTILTVLIFNGFPFLKPPTFKH